MTTLDRAFKLSLALGTLFGFMGCAEQADVDQARAVDPIMSENGLSMNGLSMNGLSMNGLSMNGLSMNGLSMNGLSMNGLSTLSGLSSTAGLMTTPGGRDIVKYMVKCAYPANHNLVKQDPAGISYTFPGALGVAPEMETGLCDTACQERVSACMLAHVNNAGVHIALWLDSEDAIGWGQSTDYPYQEGSFFGNLFARNSWSGYYCLGKDFDVGAVPGRLGSALASSVYVDPFGSNVGCANAQCVAHGGGDGFDSCTTGGHTWTHVVTAWRNFDPNTIYKICGYSTGKCLGVVGSSMLDGAQVEARGYNGAPSQAWWILQVSPGQYKLINVNSGKAVDQDSGRVRHLVQKTFAGGPTQLIAVKSLGAISQFGRYNVVPSSGTTAFDVTTSNDGAIVQLDTNISSDSSKWTIVPVGTLVSGGGATDDGMADDGGTPGTNPCASLCANPTTFGGPTYQSNNLGTAAKCIETTAAITGINCGNMNGRSLSINGTTVNCGGANLTPPPKVNGGYCFQASAGGQASAFLSTW